MCNNRFLSPSLLLFLSNLIFYDNESRTVFVVSFLSPTCDAMPLNIKQYIEATKRLGHENICDNAE